MLYVDDIILTRSHIKKIMEVKQALNDVFEITDLGLLHFCLGLQVWQMEGRTFMSQEKYATGMLKTFHMEGCKPVPTPLEINLKLSQEDESEPVDSTMYRRLVDSLIYFAKY